MSDETTKLNDLTPDKINAAKGATSKDISTNQTDTAATTTLNALNAAIATTVAAKTTNNNAQATLN